MCLDIMNLAVFEKTNVRKKIGRNDLFGNVRRYYFLQIYKYFTVAYGIFLAHGTSISASASGAEKCHLTPHVRQVACDDFTFSRALLLYKITFILLGSGRKQ